MEKQKIHNRHLKVTTGLEDGFEQIDREMINGFPPSCLLSIQERLEVTELW